MFIPLSLFEFFNYSFFRSAIVCTIVCLSMKLFCVKHLTERKKNNLPSPPGPKGLPILGYLPFIKKQMHLTLTDLSKKYGPIYQIFLGQTPFVIISNAKLVREAFRQQVFSGRPSNELTKIIKGYGVVNSDGELWREQRAFIHSVLKKFGAKTMINGKTELEKIINDEIQVLMMEIKKLNRKCSNIKTKIAHTVTNVICSLFMDYRFQTDEDDNFRRFNEVMGEGFKLLNIAMILNFFPITRYIPFVNRAFEQIKKNHAETGRFFKQNVKNHRDTLDKFKIRDVCDAYILEHDKIKQDGRKSYFSEEQLVQIMNDMVSTGIETVTNTLDWTMLFFILYPQVQINIQKEIDEVIGVNRLPELNDLVNMPYTEATMYEILRRSSIVALGHVHATLEDTELGGYKISKGTHILSNLYSIHMDPTNWENPEIFEPKRFLKNGKLIKPDNFMPFSVGRRMCLGDVLTKMEFFLFITNLLYNYNIVCGSEQKPKLDIICATMNFLKPYEVEFIPRNEFRKKK